MDALLRRRMMMLAGSTPGPGPEPPTPVLPDVTYRNADVTWTSGYYVNAGTGNLTSLGLFSAGGYIDVSGYSWIELYACYTQGGAFYDSNKTYISGMRTSNDKTWPVRFSIPSNAKYVRFNKRNQDAASIVYCTLTNVEQTVLGNTDLTWTTGKYANANTGQLVTLSGFSASSYIDLSGYTKIELYACYSQGGAFYDVNQSYVSGMKTSEDVTTPIQFDIPTGAAYCRVNKFNSDSRIYYRLIL